MFGFMEPSPKKTFSDNFNSLSLRNLTPTGVNKIRNSDYFNGIPKLNVIGDGLRDALPGIPENWSLYPGSNLSMDIVSFYTTTINGSLCRVMRLRLYGTGGNDSYIQAEENKVIASVPQSNWCLSLYGALAAGGTGLTNVNYMAIDPTSWTEDFAYVSGGWNNIATSLNTTLTKYDAPFVTGNGSTWVKPVMTIGTASGPVDFYFDLCCWQFENNTASTAYQLTNSNNGVWNSSYVWGPNTTINNEQEYYPDIAAFGSRYSLNINPFSINNSILKITGQKPASGTLPNSRQYVSGVLTTHRKFSQKYGYFEASMKWSSGQGIWPAFWMIPTIVDKTPDGRQEIDIMEWPGLGVDINDNQINLAVHYGTNSAPQSDGLAVPVPTGSMHNSFNTYGVEWRPDKMKFYINRKLVWQINTPSGVNIPMYIILNLALGGNWPGSISNEAVLPATFEIDYVDAWDKLPY